MLAARRGAFCALPRFALPYVARRTEIARESAHHPAMTRIMAILVLATTFGVGALHAQEKGGGSDAAITRQIEHGLASDAVLRGMEIYVETLDGVVNLTGFVRTLEDIARAGAVAKRVLGVSAVRNGLRVADRPSRA
ncbi:MAG TPA: BON domain-containing protein [Burkholderiales bacterium]